MAIRRRGKSWLVTVELGRDPTTGKRRRAFVTMPTRREAKHEETRLRHQAATGLDLEPTKIALADYLQRWLAAMQPNLAPATYLRYEGILRHQVNPYLGAIPLPKLRPLHVQQLYARLQKFGRVDGRGGLSSRTLVHVHRVLSEALEQAVRWQFIARNACQMAEAPKTRRVEIRTLSPDEARRLLDVAQAEDSAYGDAIIVDMHTGLRQGELLGLTWGAVDLDRGRISVRRVLQYLPRQGLTFREPKTSGSRRTIPVGPTTLEALRRCRRRQVTHRLAMGPGHEDHGLIFASEIGAPISPNSLRPAFARILRKAAIGPLRFHDLRHLHASLLLARGVHPKIVSERLGHASIAITLDTYSHVLPDLQEDAAHDLDAWLAGRG